MKIWLVFVLGGLTFKGQIAASNKNTAYTLGIYQIVGTDPTNIDTDWGMLIVMPYGTLPIWQILFSANVNGKIYKRAKYSSDWTGWIKLSD